MLKKATKIKKLPLCTTQKDKIRLSNNLQKNGKMENKLRLYGLSLKCPFDDECLDCPLIKIRELKDFEKIIEHVNSLSIEKINELIDEHNKRREEREKHIWGKR